MTLKDIAAESRRNAVEKGFYEELESARVYLQGIDTIQAARTLKLLEKLWIGMRLSLIHSEVSEMLEALRDGDTGERTGDNGKPEGFLSEAADVVIRLADLVHGQDLDGAVARKMAYNRTRPVKHGKKEGL